MADQYLIYPPAGSSSGSSGPIEFILDGAPQEVTEDTNTPANNIPLPVQLQDDQGNINTVTIAGTVPLPTGSATAANQVLEIAALDSIDGKTVVVDTDNVTVVSSVLPTGAATESTLSTLNGKVTACDTGAVVVASSALPTGASIEAKQPALGTAGTASADVITVQGIASMTPIVVDGSGSTQPISGTVTANQGGTWNINDISGTISLPTGAATETTLAAASAKLPATLGQKTSANSMAVVVASDQSAIPTSNTPGANGSGSSAAATVSTVITLTAPANAKGFILMIMDTSTANVRWSIGRTASATLGQQLQPGRDTGFIPCSHDVSLCAESGTQTYDIQWIST